MKNSVLIFTTISLLTSGGVFAQASSAQRGTNTEGKSQRTVVTVRTTARSPSQDSAPTQSDSTKDESGNNTQPDPAIMPYMNGGYYDAKQPAN